MPDKNRVVVGMSGGVDSTATAWLLKEAGYDVIGVTMKLWEDDDPDYVEKEGGCCSLSSIDDARRVCDKIGIPFYVINFKPVFREKVIDYFIDEYQQGRTPNPCIACNKYVKFDALIKKAHELDAYYVATGHYAKIEQIPETGRYVIRLSEEKHKDQTYVLCNLTQDQLKHILMPLGAFDSKEKVREIAARFDPHVGGKSDSQEICFIPDDDHSRFLNEQLGDAIKTGDFVDPAGKKLGRHKGIVHYTIGQRKGLGLALPKPGYVTKIEPATNLVIVGGAEDVFSDTLYANDLNFMPFETLTEPMRVMAKIRYAAPQAAATIYPEVDKVKVVFDTPQRAITPGQAVAFYVGDMLIGGATIL
jgi:tRNA-specific 2-thiouridylase